MKYILNAKSDYGNCDIDNRAVIFTADNSYENAFFKMELTLPDFDDSTFLMMPSCAYDSNRIKRVTRSYPPMYHADEIGVDAEPIMTNVPGLNPDLTGQFKVTSADMATPCVCVFDRTNKKSLFLFTQQSVKEKLIGFTVTAGKIEISFPSNRERDYRMCGGYVPSKDSGINVEKSEQIRSEFLLKTFNCEDIAQFYEQYFNLRKALLGGERAKFAYNKKLWDIMENHFNDNCWNGDSYADVGGKWQCGWTGGAMATFPLLKHGSGKTVKRARQNLDFLVKTQAPSGFYHGIVDKGEILDDGFGESAMKNAHLVRKSADVLYFWFKHFDIVQPEPSWEQSARKCADAFVRLYERYGTFGQFVNVLTGDMMYGASTSAAIAPGALARAWQYFGDKEYLETATKSLDLYVAKFLEKGYTNGGPGEILSAIDAESGFALLESCVAVYEATKEQKWLDFAQTVAYYCSSWVMSYQYTFPKTSEFGRLNINTVGSVFASVQNKHSAPGICTLSGDSILKLYRYTKNEKFLELIKDISYFIPQCVSTNEKPIYDWSPERVPLKEGYVCERVNTSDWEGPENVGGVFNASCWCETSLILSFAELMIHDEMTD